MTKNFYEILGVHSNSTEEEIRKAYRKKAIECHPDKNPDNIEEAETDFKALGEAYEVLSDENLREEYDQTHNVHSYESINHSYYEPFNHSPRGSPPSRNPFYNAFFNGSPPSFSYASRRNPYPTRTAAEVPCLRCLSCLRGDKCSLEKYYENEQSHTRQGHIPTSASNNGPPRGAYKGKGAEVRIDMAVSPDELYHGAVKWVDPASIPEGMTPLETGGGFIVINGGEALGRQYCFKNFLRDQEWYLHDLVVTLTDFWSATF